MKIKSLYAGFALILGSYLPASADFINITVDGNFSDWDTVPVLATDLADNVGSIDFETLQVANNADFLFVRYTLHASINPNGTGSGTFFALDEDNNAATGFDVFGLNLVGSEAGWQNDFPFEQATGVFNTGNGLTGATYAAAPFNTATVSVEFSIPRTATHTLGGTPVIPADGETIALMMWNQEGVSDVISGAYTLSAVPEPSTLALFAFGVLVIFRARKLAS